MHGPMNLKLSPLIFSYRVQYTAQLVSILYVVKLVDIFAMYFHKIYFNIILTSAGNFSKDIIHTGQGF